MRAILTGNISHEGAAKDILCGSLSKDDFRQPRPAAVFPVNKPKGGPGVAGDAERAQKRRWRRGQTDDALKSKGITPKTLGGIKVDLRGAYDAPPRDDEEKEERDRIEEKVKECVSRAHDKATLDRYASTLRVLVGGVERAVGSELLPMDNEDKLMALFGAMTGLPWSTIQVNKAAIRHWHSIHGFDREYDAAWSERACLFWKGLKKTADHSRKYTKWPLSHEKLQAYQQHSLQKSSQVGIRDAAIVSICFYGARRISETLALSREDVKIDDDFIEVFIARQKNDKYDRGHRCWVPRIPGLLDLCPWTLVKAWIDRWDRKWKSAPKDSPLFFVQNKKEPKPVSYDYVRKSLTGLFGSRDTGTHSLRKGGAAWLRFTLHLDEEVIQSQGGWADRACMQKAYTIITERYQRDSLVEGAALVGAGKNGPQEKRARVEQDSSVRSGAFARRSS